MEVIVSSEAKRSRWWENALPAAVCSIACVVWSGALAVSLGWSLDPVILLLFAGFALLPTCALSVGLVCWSGSKPMRWWATGLLAFILALYLIPWHPRQVFTMRLERIPVGASEADVRSRMAGYWGGSMDVLDSSSVPGQFHDKRITHSMTYGWSHDGAYNSDFGVVYLSQGRVVATAFWPD
jgi:hypothetical protein